MGKKLLSLIEKISFKNIFLPFLTYYVNKSSIVKKNQKFLLDRLQAARSGF
jgi:hypothetical protein